MCHDCPCRPQKKGKRGLLNQSESTNYANNFLNETMTLIYLILNKIYIRENKPLFSSLN